MHFIADKQTINDLNLLGKYKPDSIYSLFCKVKTRGGEQLLEEMFRQPMTNVNAINQRAAIIRSVQELELKLPVEPALFQVAEEYLAGIAAPSLVLSAFAIFRKKVMATFLRDEQLETLTTGLHAAIQLLQQMRSFVKPLQANLPGPWAGQIEQLKRVLFSKELVWLEKELPASISVMQLARLDHLLRHVMQADMQLVLRNICEWDVYIAVSDVAREKNFSYALALPATTGVLNASAIWHPALRKPVVNPVDLDQESNLLFLTGANMAGKSTFMKSLGIVVYLAHMGFPVPAKELCFSVLNGLCSSINVSDNLGMGYSHFYAEVLRVKHVAEEVSRGHRMMVIFDELFKGTNVKDAFDATLAATRAFAAYRNCFFVVSTHIVEVGEELKKAGNVRFAFLPAIMKAQVPHYTYLLTEGISADRQGMMIIEKEGILELLRN